MKKRIRVVGASILSITVIAVCGIGVATSENKSPASLSQEIKGPGSDDPPSLPPGYVQSIGIENTLEIQLSSSILNKFMRDVTNTAMRSQSFCALTTAQFDCAFITADPNPNFS
jgi:hypothetical protein